MSWVRVGGQNGKDIHLVLELSWVCVGGQNEQWIFTVHAIQKKGKKWNSNSKQGFRSRSLKYQSSWKNYENICIFKKLSKYI